MAAPIEFFVVAPNLAGIGVERMPVIRRLIMDRLNTVDARVQRKIQAKLEGEVLKSHTHQLSNSVRIIPAEDLGDIIQSGVQAGGGTVVQALFQEEGTRGPYEIKPKNKLALAFFPQGSAGATSPHKTAIRQVLRRKASVIGPLSKRKLAQQVAARESFGDLGGVVVAKVIHPGLEAKHFMRDSLQESQSDFITAVQEAINEGIGGGIR